MNEVTTFEAHRKPILTSTDDRLFDSLRELKDLLVRRRGSLAACLIGCLLLAAAYLTVAAPKFTASATLMVDGRHTDVVHQEPATADAQILNAMVESEVEVLRSPGLARQVVDRLKLVSDPLFVARTRPASSASDDVGVPLAADQIQARARERAAQQLLRMLSVKRIGMTYVIEVDVTAPSPREAARLVNGITGTYLAMAVQIQGNTTREAADWLNTQLETLRQQALKADEAVQSFKAENGIIDTDQGSLEKEQVATLNNQLLAATGRTAQAQARIDQLSSAAAENGSAGAAVSDVIQDPVLTELQQHYFDVEQREEELAARFGSSHAIVRKLKGRMAELQGSIHQEIARIASAARSDAAIARTNEATIRSQLAGLLDRSGVSGTAQAKLRSLESSAAIYRTIYTSSLQHYAQSMQDQSFPVVAAHVVTPAEPPLAKSKPRKLFVLAGALVLGVAAGVVLALVLEFLDQTLVSVGQIERELGVGCLARLPRLVLRGDAERREIALTSLMTAFPDSRFAGEIRRLRLRILLQLGEARCGIVGVMASKRGDGTSVVAHNLSSALTASGRSVALVSLPGSRLASCPTGTSIVAPSNALAVIDVRSEASGDLLRRLSDLRLMHDILVLDLPPLFDLDEALDVIRVLDCLVLVAQSGVTSARDLLELVDGNGVDWTRVAGVVLNRADRETIKLANP